MGKGAVGDVEDNVDEAAMQIDLTSRAADVQADTQSTWETTDENIDLVASQGSGERGSQREVLISLIRTTREEINLYLGIHLKEATFTKKIYVKKNLNKKTTTRGGGGVWWRKGKGEGAKER